MERLSARKPLWKCENLINLEVIILRQAEQHELADPADMAETDLLDNALLLQLLFTSKFIIRLTGFMIFL